MTIFKVKKKVSNIKGPDLVLNSAADEIMVPLTCGMCTICKRPRYRFTRLDTFALCNPNQIIQVGRDTRKSLLTCCSQQGQPCGWSRVCSEILSGLSWKTPRTETRQPCCSSPVFIGEKNPISSQNMFSAYAIVFYKY